jgi:hypothetical protein
LRFGKIALLLALAGPAQAQVLAPPSWPLGQAELKLAGEAGGALFSPDQPGWDGAQSQRRAAPDAGTEAQLRQRPGAGAGRHLHRGRSPVARPL